MSSRSTKLSIVVLILLLVGVVGGGLWGVQRSLRPPEALQEPSVVQTAPIPDVPTSRVPTVEFLFDHKMDHASVEASLVVRPPFAYTTAWRDEGRSERLILQPKETLPWETTYVVTLGIGAQNRSGRAMTKEASITFTTGGEVRVVEALPAQGAAETAPAQAIRVRFDRSLVEVASLESQDGLPQPILLTPPTPGIGRWLAPDTYAFYPDQPLAAGTMYQAVVSQAVAPGYELAAPFEWAFSTVGPQVQASFPVSGTSEVSRATTVRLLFAQPMDPQSVEQNFQLSIEGVPTEVAGEFQWEDERTLLYVPYEPLRPNATYVVQVGEDAKALGGARGLATPYRTTWTTVDHLAVESAQPAPGSTEVSLVPTDTVIAVQFNHPVVAVTGVAEAETLPDPLQVSPALEGSGEWVTTSLFVFRPTEPLAPSTEYVVTARADLPDALGSTLREEYSWSFTSEFPRVLRLEPSNARRVVAPQGPIGLRFNQPMDPRSAEAAFTLSDEAGSGIEGRIEWAEGNTLLQFFPTEPLTREAEYRIALAAGARGGRGGETGEGFNAEVTAAPAPRVVTHDPQAGATAEPYTSVVFTFNVPMTLDPRTVAGQITVEPAPNGIYPYYDPESFQLYVNFGERLAPDTRYTVTLDGAVTSESGEPLGDDLTFSFRTGSLPPRLVLATTYPLNTLNPLAEPTILADALNLSRLDVELRRVSAEAIPTLLDRNTFFRAEMVGGDLVERWSVELEGARNESALTPIPLPLEAEARHGFYLLRITAPEMEYTLSSILLFTPINLTFKRAPDEVLVWATDMATGKPAEGVMLRLRDGEQQVAGGETDAEGLFRTSLPANVLRDFSYFTAMAYTEDEPIAIGNPTWTGDAGAWQWGYTVNENPPELYGSLYSERPIYRPGQTMFFRGVLREREGRDFILPTLPSMEVRILFNGEPVATRPVTLSRFGTFAGEFTLDEEAEPGYYSLELKQDAYDLCPSDGYCPSLVQTAFQVAEYVRPTFQVGVEVAQEAIVQGEPLSATVAATYYAGGAVGNSEVRWRQTSQPYFYPGPTLSGWWNWQDGDAFMFNMVPTNTVATLDPAGQAEWQLSTDLDVAGQLGPMDSTEGPLVSQQVTVEAEVQDEGDTLIAGRDTLIVHAGAFYIGLNNEAWFTQAGEPVTLNVATADTLGVLEGNHRLTLELYRRQWGSTPDSFGSGWRSVFTDTLVASEEARTDSGGRATITFTPEEGGSYSVLARGADGQGNEVRSRTFLWVSDEEVSQLWGVTQDDQLTLTTDKQEYQVGDVARIFVPTDEPGMTALISQEALELRDVSVRTLAGTGEIIEVPITEDMIPNLYVNVVVLSGTTAEQPAPRFGMGYVNLPVARDSKELTVEVEAVGNEGGTLPQPGEEVTLRVRVRDHAGEPVTAELSLAMVDKAVLDLAEIEQGTLVDAFYNTRPLAVLTGSSYTLNLDRLNERFLPGREGGGGGGGGGEASIATVREELKDTAFWQADILTNAQGEAEVRVTLPDNLTTWVLLAKATTEEGPLVGETQGSFVATKPLRVEPLFPRFLTVGDEAMLRAVLHNATMQGVEATVTLDARGLEAEQAVQVVRVGPGGRTIVTFPVQVISAGEATVTLRAEGGGLSDGIEQRFPVYALTAPEITASSGLVRAREGAAVEEISLPVGTDMTQGELTVELSPSLAGAARTTLDWLAAYPYDNTEAVASRLLANAATLGALRALEARDASLQQKLTRAIEEDITNLAGRQNPDGGWGWWPKEESHTWISAYVSLALVEAERSGGTAPGQATGGGTRYLQGWLARTEAMQDNETLETRAFALYVLSEAGAGDGQQAAALFGQQVLLGNDARAFLLLALDNAGGQDASVQTLSASLTANARLSATGAHWEEAPPNPLTFDSSLRSTALALRALARVEPEHLLLPQTVRWLMHAREVEHWQTTEQSAWAVLSLADFLRVTGEGQGEFSFEVALNGEIVTSEQVTPANRAGPITLRVALSTLLRDEANQLVITQEPKAGQVGGRLFYGVWLRVYRAAEQVAALNRGIGVARRYEAVDPVTMRSRGGRIETAEAGELVMVRLTVEAPADIHFFRLEDPIPAGFEIVDPTLATTSQGAGEPSQDGGGAPGSLFRYAGTSSYLIQDERVTLFSNLLPRGTYEFTYLLRARVPGTFRAPPALATEHYHPEVFGRSDSAELTVEVGE